MGPFWIGVGVVLGLVSLLLGSVALLLVAILLLGLSLISRQWARYSLARVEYDHRLSTYRVFPGESLDMEVEIVNGKALPLPWLEVVDDLPREMTVLGARTGTSFDSTRVSFPHVFSLGWYHRIVRRYSVLCAERGYFPLGPVRISSGDLFGLFRAYAYLPANRHLLVYPRVLPVRGEGITSREPFGPQRVRRHILEDPTRLRNVRDYLPGDSRRYIHWKATARLGHPQTRVFESTTVSHFVLFLDVRTLEEPLQGSKPHLLELAVLTAAALANHAIQEGRSVGVYVNQTERQSAQRMRVPPTRHPDQLMRVLEVMAQVHGTEDQPLSELLLDESRTLAWGGTFVAVAAVPSSATLGALQRLRRAGRWVSLVQIGGPPRDTAAGIPTLRVPETMEWRGLEEILLQ